MKEITGNIWDQACDWLCITTNGIIKKNGKAVMGAGIALQARERFRDIDLILAQRITDKGNVVSPLVYDEEYGRWIISFPTKKHFKYSSDMKLIEKSARDLKTHYDKQKVKPKVVIPKPGCANGGLKWKDVKKVIEKILVDDDFIIIDRG